MSRRLQTFVSYKYFKDAGGIQYAILYSHSENPIVTIKADSGISIDSDARSTLRNGATEIIVKYSGGGRINATFKDRTYISLTFPVIPDADKLSVPFSELSRSFTFDVADSPSVGYEISDSLYYNKNVNRELYIFPSSENPHLDPSSSEDFYYLGDGGAAYVASTSLQNKFLNDIDYSLNRSESEDLGRFRGGLDDNTELKFTATPNAEGDEQPRVRGGIASFRMLPRNDDGDSIPPTDKEVCMDPSGSNYYLIGCENQELPCTDSGAAHAQACDGTTLTSDILNTGIHIDGGCCTYTTGCDGYNISVGEQTLADTDLANGTVTITVTGGTANFTATVDDIELNNPTIVFNSGNPQVTSGLSDSTFTLTGLLAGTYTITVTDSTGGTACTDETTFTIRENIVEPESEYGCKDLSSAINYDASARTHEDRACVFCNATTGKLEADVTDPVTLGPWVLEIPGASTVSATSSPSGVSQSDGSIVFQGINIAGSYELFPDFSFDTFAEFTTSDQADPIDYKLYKLNEGFALNDAYIAITNGESGLTVLTSNASLITTYSGTGGANTFTDLASGHYAIVAVYDNDGTQDGDDEVEQCYEIFGTYIVGQAGCTDPESDNYNPDATFDDGSCSFPPENNNNEVECGSLNFGVDVSCNIDAFNPLIITPLPITETNPGIQDAVDNGYTIPESSGSPFAGVFNPPVNFSNGANYVWYEILCWHIYNPNATALPSGGSPDDSEFNLNTNGFAVTAGGPAHMFVINHSIVLGDGAVYNSNPSSTLQQIKDQEEILSNLPWSSLTNFDFCDYVAIHGVPTGVEFSYNYGTGNVYEFTETVFVPFTQEQIDTITACCGIETEIVEGCTDPTALNFDESAIVACNGDNSCCEYPVEEEVPGCTDPAASNYNPLATVDDGSCEYPPSQDGSWAQTSCFACDYFPNNLNFYSTEAECIGNIDPDNDCCELNNFEEIASVSANSAGSSSTFNPDTNLCEDNNTGQFRAFLDGGELQNLIDSLQNPETVMYNWVVVNFTQDLYWQTGSGSEGTPVPPDGLIPNLYSGEVDVLPITGLNTNGSSIIADLDNVPHGQYAITINMYHQGYYDDEGNPKIPDLTSFGPDVVCADALFASINVTLDNCDDGGGNNIVHGCTDPEAINYLLNCEGVSVPDANVEAGCCEYEEEEPPNGCLCQDGTFDDSCCPPDPVCGCMDPNAINYNNAATFQDDSICPCEYEIVGCIEDCAPVTTTIPACIPPNVGNLIEHNEECISRVGHRFYTKHITGIGDNCSNMETWKLVIINELISREGLPCMFNCSDSETPLLEDAENDCNALWISGGSQTWNPIDAPGYGIGVVVKRLGVLYVARSNTGLTIDPISNNLARGWRRCISFVNKTETKDYLRKFISFAQEYCKDCGIPPYRNYSQTSSSLENQFNVGGNSFTVGGIDFTNTGDQSGLTSDNNTGEASGDEAFEDLG